MGLTEWKKREEEDFLTDWRRVFGLKGVGVVEKMAQRLNLDYGGMDCSLLPNGDVLFFEANACMMVQFDDATNTSIKQKAVLEIRQAVTDMIRSRIMNSQGG